MISLADSIEINSVQGAEISLLSRSDVDSLADLMMDAYVGTIDHERESLSEAVDEVESWFDGAPLVQRSYGVVAEDVLVSAVMLSSVADVPFIGYGMARASAKRQGLGTYVTAVALASLRDAGEGQVVFYITGGERCFREFVSSFGRGATAQARRRRPVRPTGSGLTVLHVSGEVEHSNGLSTNLLSDLPATRLDATDRRGYRAHLA